MIKLKVCHRPFLACFARPFLPLTRVLICHLVKVCFPLVHLRFVSHLIACPDAPSSSTTITLSLALTLGHSAPHSPSPSPAPSLLPSCTFRSSSLAPLFTTLSPSLSPSTTRLHP